MIKEMTMGEVRIAGTTLLNNWEAERSNIRLGGRSLYNLIAIKKEFEQQVLKIQETVSTLAQNAGGEAQENGSFRIPEENIDDLNARLQELNDEVIEIEYAPIVMKDSDNLPPIFMDALFDFIEIE